VSDHWWTVVDVPAEILEYDLIARTFTIADGNCVVVVDLLTNEIVRVIP